MKYEKIKNANLSSYVIVSDISSKPIEVSSIDTSGMLIANIKLDGNDNNVFITNERLSAAVGISELVNVIQ